jgi:hypothetical protein
MAGNKGKVPQVPKRGGGTKERDRNNDGRWRDKRSDAGKKRAERAEGTPG